MLRLEGSRQLAERNTSYEGCRSTTCGLPRAITSICKISAVLRTGKPWTSHRRTFTFGCSLFYATSIVRTFPEHVEDRKMILDASDPLLFPRRVNIEFRPTKRDLPKGRRDDENVSRAARMPRVDDFRGILEHVSLLIDRSVGLIVDHEKRPRVLQI